MRQSYLQSVTKLLNIIHSFSAGTAVLRQLQVTKHIVEIYPKIFAAAWQLGFVAFTQDKIRNQNQGTPFQLRAFAAETRRLERVCVAGGKRCIVGTGEGVGVNVFFDPHFRNRPFMAEDTLVHELTHAGRYKLGIVYRGAKVRDIEYEEFIANLIENIFRSERGAAPLDYLGRPINPKTFLIPEIRKVISELSRPDIGQPALFRQLAHIQCNFNPIRDVAPAT
jgi:hypothetical protein